LRRLRGAGGSVECVRANAILSERRNIVIAIIEQDRGGPNFGADLAANPREWHWLSARLAGESACLTYTESPVG
jgi:hypothetical protein